jgi:hypothetical protein
MAGTRDVAGGAAIRVAPPLAVGLILVVHRVVVVQPGAATGI